MYNLIESIEPIKVRLGLTILTGIIAFLSCFMVGVIWEDLFIWLSNGLAFDPTMLAMSIFIPIIYMLIVFKSEKMIFLGILGGVISSLGSGLMQFADNKGQSIFISISIVLFITGLAMFYYALYKNHKYRIKLHKQVIRIKTIYNQRKNND